MLLPIEGAHALPLIADCLKNDQFLGIVQIKNNNDFYTTGTVGKILDFQEIDQDKICVLIEGLACFELISYEKTDHAYIKGIVHYKMHHMSATFSRDRLKKALVHYFFKLNIEPNWDLINRYSDQHLVQYLLGFCPFESIEKQCLLEAKSLNEQCSLLTQILELSFMRNRCEMSTH